jgi:hypothetical protein
MIHIRPPELVRYQRTRYTSPEKRVTFGPKILARTDTGTAARKWFAGLLWRAFPGCRSEREIAERAARVLDVSPRQVQNWLRCENDAGVRYVFAVLTIAGAEIVFRKLEGDGE